MYKIKNRVIILIMIMFLILMSLTVIANAYSADDLINGQNVENIDINKSYVLSRSDIFCIQHNTPLPDSEAKKYTVRGPIIIDGNTASYNSGVTTITNNANGTLAYILAKGVELGGYKKNDNYTDGQIALWHYYEEWYNLVCNTDSEYKSHTCGPSDKNKDVALTEDAKKLINEARDYATRIGTGLQVAIGDNTNKDNIVVTPYNDPNDAQTYIRVGPFNFSYTGTTA